MIFFGELQEMKKIVWRILLTLQHTPNGFHQDASHFGDLIVRKSGMELTSNKPNGEWNRVAEIMMINFAESGHPIFQATSP